MTKRGNVLYLFISHRPFLLPWTNTGVICALLAVLISGESAAFPQTPIRLAEFNGSAKTSDY
jgi:hypothetical protein